MIRLIPVYSKSRSTCADETSGKPVHTRVPAAASSGRKSSQAGVVVWLRRQFATCLLMTKGKTWGERRMEMRLAKSRSILFFARNGHLMFAGLYRGCEIVGFRVANWLLLIWVKPCQSARHLTSSEGLERRRQEEPRRGRKLDYRSERPAICT